MMLQFASTALRGDTVNLASFMSREVRPAGRFNISRSTYDLIKDDFECVPRGPIEVKHGVRVEMFFVEREVAPAQRAPVRRCG